MMVSWAIHRLNGISCPASAAYSASELAFQLKNSRASCLFTCVQLLPIALKAAKLAGIATNRIYLLSVPEQAPISPQESSGMKDLEELISHGGRLPELEAQEWSKVQGKRQTAFICYSSGTSGLPVGSS